MKTRNIALELRNTAKAKYPSSSQFVEEAVETFLAQCKIRASEGFCFHYVETKIPQIITSNMTFRESNAELTKMVDLANNLLKSYGFKFPRAYTNQPDNGSNDFIMAVEW